MSAWGARGPGISGPGTCGRTSVARRPYVAACATAKQQKQQQQQLRRDRVRVLRYPNGTERVIRYPDEATTTAALEAASLDEEEQVAWDVSGLHGAGGATMPRSNAAAAWSAQAAAPATTERSSHEPTDAAPAGPSSADALAYLEGLFAAAYAGHPADASVDDRYELLYGSPWVLPRPVFVLAMRRDGGGGTSGGEGAGGVNSGGISAAAAAATSDSDTAESAEAAASTLGAAYTLRVKVVQPGAASALAELLGKPALAPSLEVAQMRDGVVAFERDADADRYASLLEEEGAARVAVAQVDSHALFRLVGDAKGVVVLLRAGVDVPAPFQLAASLKKKRAWDSL